MAHPSAPSEYALDALVAELVGHDQPHIPIVLGGQRLGVSQSMVSEEIGSRPAAASVCPREECG